MTHTEATPETLPGIQNPQRHDVYSGVHKALRALMCDTLVRMGRVDVDDDTDLEQALNGVDTLLVLLSAHLQQEDELIHPLLDARRPGTSTPADDDHRRQSQDMDAIGNDACQLRARPRGDRRAAATVLCRRIALLVADNLQHMAVEETAHNAVLWATCSDEKLAALHARLRVHPEPLVRLNQLDWIVRSFGVAELADMLARGLRGMPAVAARDVLSRVRMGLDETR